MAYPRTFTFLPLIVASAVGTASCELVSGVDRGKIPNTGGASSSSETGPTTSTTTGPGGSGGMGGNAGGMGGKGGSGGSGTGGNTGGAGGIGGSGTGGAGGGVGGAGGGVGGAGVGGAGVGGAGVGGAGVGGAGVGGAGVGGAGVGGSGGAGGGPQCMLPSDCPPTGNECIAPTCVLAVCGTKFVAQGTPTVSQTAGDCMQKQCDGAGSTQNAVDVNDLPVDNNPCTDDVCSPAGVPSNPAFMAGTNCGMNLVCNGMGNCVGCNMASDCAGSDTECHVRTCMGGMCGQNNTMAGFVVMGQTAGDCKQNQCDGSGNIVAVPDDNDKPVDNLQCTNDVCTNGVPSNPAVQVGTPCSQGGVVCDGNGACVNQCNVPGDCPGIDDECKQRSCNMGACGFNFTNAGFVTASQTTGDCKQNQCDGSGNIVSVNDNNDKPVDGNQCTDDVCTNGVPSNPNSPARTACSQGNKTLCDGSGNCVECLANGDCASNVCTGNACQASTCNDVMKNGNETDVDCGGGVCPACADFKACLVDTDCSGGVCTLNKCQTAWINELHYDNVGADTGEAVEIAGTAGLDLSGWTVVLYNGNGGGTYLPNPNPTSLNLTGVIPNQQANKGTLTFAAAGIQNGAPDGLALVAPGNVVIQFLSYEGTFMATNGPAMGMNSIDIGVSEEPPPVAGLSLQLVGTGKKYADFTWAAAPAAASQGSINALQIFN